MLEVGKELEDVLAGISIFFNSETYEFCLEYDVKVGKVNFDSPGTIRDKSFFFHDSSVKTTHKNWK
jgi:hypothetical protein